MSPGKSASSHGSSSQGHSSPSPAQRSLTFMGLPQMPNAKDSPKLPEPVRLENKYTGDGLTKSSKESSTGDALTKPVKSSKGNKSPVQSKSAVSEKSPVASKSTSGNSWADKVKGVLTKSVSLFQHQDKTTKQSKESKIVENDEDGQGWETVQRGGKLKSRHSPSQKSLENLASTSSEEKNMLQRSRSVPHTSKSEENKLNVDADNTSRTMSDSQLGVRIDTPSKALDSRFSSDEEMDALVHQLDLLQKSKSKETSKDKLGTDISSTSASRRSPSPRRKRQDSEKENVPQNNRNLPAGSMGNGYGLDDEQMGVVEEARSQQLDKALVKALNKDDPLSSRLELEQNQAIQSAINEEQTALKALAHEESKEIVVVAEGEKEPKETNPNSMETDNHPLDWDAMVAAYDAEESHGLKTWGEMTEEADMRMPGHGVQMHEKLSSPSRKRSPTESRRRHEEKQAKAQELREKLMHEKSDRLKELLKKVEEVRDWKEELMRQRRVTIEHKLQQAEIKRLSQLKIKSKKAHEEEAKAHEIAFINTLEAQNKRHDIMSKHLESEARLQELLDERLRKIGAKQAKGAAVEERRRALELERKRRLQDLQERRRLRDIRITQHQMEKEKERLQAARVKEKDREERMAAMNLQQQQHIQDLQKKIQQKQDDSSQRHEVILKQISEKAFVMSVLRHSTEDHNDAPRLTLYDKQKLCTICNVLIPSEVYLLSHLRGKKHQQALKDNSKETTMSKQEIETFNLQHIVDAPDNSDHPKIVTEKERQKLLKKRCKKLRARMTSRGLEYEGVMVNKQQTAESENKFKIQKIIKDLNKQLQSQDSGPWPNNRVSSTDRAILELSRIFDKKQTMADCVVFRVLGGLTTLSRILMTIDASTISLPPVIPQKCLIQTCDAYRLACRACFENSHYMLFSNKLGCLVDELMHQLMLLLPDEVTMSSCIEDPKLPYDPLSASLMQVVASVLSCLAKNHPSINTSEASLVRMSSSGDAFANRGNDIISYIISVGVIDKLQYYFCNVRGPVDDDKNAADFLQHSLGLLVAMTKFMSKRNTNVFETKRSDDMTGLVATFEVTELVGIVSLLYGMLLHSGAPSRGDTAPPELPQHTLLVTLTGLRMLNHMAALDLHMLQRTLGEEGMSLEFRHISSYLIWYCCHHVQMEELLHEVILCVGYFTVLNYDNQVFIQSGQAPTVLQQLCALPFSYFCDPRLINVLFPTLISCCYNNESNRSILEQELSCALLANFIEEKQLEIQQAKIFPQTTKKSRTAQDKEYREMDNRMMLAHRFPLDEWSQAEKYLFVE